MLYSIFRAVSRILLPILVPMVISIISLYQFYKYPTKIKKKNIQISSKTNHCIKFYMNIVIFIPLVFFSIQKGLYDLMSIIAATIIFILPCFAYIKESIKYDNVRGLRFKSIDRSKKVCYTFRNYVAPIFIWSISYFMGILTVKASLFTLYIKDKCDRFIVLDFLYEWATYFLANIVFIFYIYMIHKNWLIRQANYNYNL